jgi:hypothetical protein
MPRSYLALTTLRFTFRASGIDYYGEGQTGASHDSASARGWCRMRLIFDHVAEGWTYYKATGRAKFAGEGGPGVDCQTLKQDQFQYAVRVRQAAAKLKAEFGHLQTPSDFNRYAATYLSRIT